jgi:hypothetical protein
LIMFILWTQWSEACLVANSTITGINPSIYNVLTMMMENESMVVVDWEMNKNE